MTRILVTGFNGYVGTHVVKALKARQVEITALCRNSSGVEQAKAEGLTPHIAALEDVAELRALAASVDGVAHLAASDNPAFLKTNRNAIKAMIDGLPPGSVFVMHGGSMVFGDTGSNTLSGIPIFNPPPTLAERAELDQFVLKGASTTVRTHIIYGAFVFGGLGAMIPNSLIQAARTSGFSGYIAEGSACWSAVHIADWAELIVRALLDGKHSGQPIMAAAQTISLREVAHAVSQAFTPPLPEKSVTLEEGFKLWSFFAPGFTLNQNFNADLAKEDYGWEPPMRDIAAELAFLAATPKP
ncbi:MAG: NAD-dependent epimerase/dehydratase family protein [Anaerolineae bacterium]|nr:NAD-dependent epimerase/dehydratase family protein [Gloeobacterales cyanobacterium ES-bin-313]